MKFFGTILFLGMMSSQASALPYCLQGSEGLKCWYQTAVACELVRSQHELCIEDPFELDKEAAEPYMPLPRFSDNLCLGPVCFKYFQEVCSEEEQRFDQLKCELDSSP